MENLTSSQLLKLANQADEAIMKIEQLYSLESAIEDAAQYGPNEFDSYQGALNLLGEQLYDHKTSLEKLSLGIRKGIKAPTAPAAAASKERKSVL